MIFTLNIIIDLCLVFALARLSKRKYEKYTFGGTQHIHRKVFLTDKRTPALLEQAQRRAAIAEKYADRAFTMASTATLGVIALQKSLAVPKIMTKRQTAQNALAKKQVDDLMAGSGQFDYMRPILSDEENDILDKLEEEKIKEAELNGY